jgi:small conductance mechanosensitive channel
MTLDNVMEYIAMHGVDLATKIAAAIAFWIIGRWLIGRVIALTQAAMNRNKIDPTLTKYLGSFLNIALNILLVVGILGYFGIQTTGFAALLAGAGLAIGAAWGGLLGNFAAGAFLLILRPYKPGDFVTVGGVTGTVHELGLFGTTLITPDNVVTIVGNNKIFSGDIVNYSTLPYRRVDRTAQLPNGVNVDDAIARLKAAVGAIPNIQKDPAPDVELHTDHYWQVWFDTNEAILRVAKEAGWPAPASTIIHKPG